MMPKSPKSSIRCFICIVPNNNAMACEECFISFLDDQILIYLSMGFAILRPNTSYKRHKMLKLETCKVRQKLLNPLQLGIIRKKGGVARNKGKLCRHSFL